MRFFAYLERERGFKYFLNIFRDGGSGAGDYQCSGISGKWRLLSGAGLFRYMCTVMHHFQTFTESVGVHTFLLNVFYFQKAYGI